MGLINLRDLVSFNQYPGANSSDILINGVHLNRTALEFWNYTLYDNNTISNQSACYIIFDQYKPHFLSNGSWVNATSCYVPIERIGARGAVGIGFATLYALCIVFTLINLKKHGQLFLREDKRFRAVGRRWQWYWALFVASCGMISCITGVDVDRNYLQSTAIILQGFFFTLMVPGTLAMVWEAVRHWGSWQERQICDVDPYLLPQDDKRGQSEFYQPLVFYLFAWLNFFMVIPRPWWPIEMQRSTFQQSSIAEPSATDKRMKAGGILAAIAYFVICYNLSHNLYYYKPRATGLWNKFNNFCHHCPTKLFALIVVLAIRVAYGIAAAWIWEISILKYNVEPGWPYGLGYGTTFILLVILQIGGITEENEDKVLIAQRRNRNHEADNEMGITKKPTWWSKMRGDSHLSDEQRLRALTTETAANRRSAAAPTATANVELGSMTAGLRSRSRSRPRHPDDPFRDQSTHREDYDSKGLPATSLRPRAARSETDNISTRTDSTGRTLMNAQPQHVRSMLDV